jgi:hypothetical protein
MFSRIGRIVEPVRLESLTYDASVGLYDPPALRNNTDGVEGANRAAIGGWNDDLPLNTD